MLSADPQNEEFRQIVAAIQTFVCEMMIKNGEAAESICTDIGEVIRRSPSHEIAHFRIANVQAELGKGYAALAAAAGKSAPGSLAHWRKARSWLRKSQSIYKAFHDAGKLSGDDAAR
jgi:hypothetical protein